VLIADRRESWASIPIQAACEIDELL